MEELFEEFIKNNPIGGSTATMSDLLNFMNQVKRKETDKDLAFEIEYLVKTHFKNTISVQCLLDNQVYKLDLSKKLWLNKGDIVIVDQYPHKSQGSLPLHVTLWTKKQGFANIIKSKSL